MKQTILQSNLSKKLLLSFVFVLAAITVGAKDIKTLVVTTNPKMHCESCENRIKKSLRFIKGVKNIETNVEAQKVTIQYDADKVQPNTIFDALKKIDYEATEIKKANQKENQACGQCCKGESGCK
ncbi:MAG: heavy-metal-associated domain-containing protein [Alloprevotella sp.]|nr:heavy-metal-associated domain-containing protein [Alloprevotella sp.]